MHDLLDFRKQKVYIISVCANEQFGKFFFVIVAYREGKPIQKQPSFGSVIKFLHLASGKSEPRNPGVIALIPNDAWFIGLSKEQGMDH